MEIIDRIPGVDAIVIDDKDQLFSSKNLAPPKKRVTGCRLQLLIRCWVVEGSIEAPQFNWDSLRAWPLLL
jgi:hypothetical protein